MGGNAGEREGRPGLWMIQFTACDGDRAREYARQGASGDGALEVAAAGRYGFAAVGMHQQVIALRDVVMPAVSRSGSRVRSWLSCTRMGSRCSTRAAIRGLPRAGQGAARSRPADADRWGGLS